MGYGTDAQQRFEIWRKSECEHLVVLIHGGCWMSEYGLDHVRPLASFLADSGFAVWSIEYRRLGNPGGGWPGTFADVVAAVNAIEGHNWDSPLEKISVVGHSAGGHLAMWLGAVSQNEDHPYHQQLNVSFDQVVGLAAISDLEAYARGDSPCESAARALMDGLPEAQRERYQLASPLLLNPHPNTHLIHGGADPIVPFAQSERFAEKYSNTKLHLVRNAGHFDVIHPETPSAGILRDVLLNV